MEKLLTDIKTWLTEENMQCNDVEDYESAFHLEVIYESREKALPIDIIGLHDTEVKIIVCWIWGIFPEDSKALSMIDPKVREKFVLDVKFALQLMNLSIAFFETKGDLKGMFSGIEVFTDTLTKQILLEVIDNLKKGFKFTSMKFSEVFLIPVKFDPSSHV